MLKKVLIVACLAIPWVVAVLGYETYAVEVNDVEIEIEGLPAEFDGFRIMLLADFHGRRFSPGGRTGKVITHVKPDIVCLAGDYVHHRPDEVANILPLIQNLTRDYPVYAVSGNHDQWAGWDYINKELEQAGVTVLENRHVRLCRNESQVILAGAGDPHTGAGKLEDALPGNIDATVILLIHAPKWFEPWHNPIDLPPDAELLEQVSLTMAGHTHGGQIKIPFVGALTTASGKAFPRSHVQGLSWEGHGWLYITRGIGQGGLVDFRFLSRPEVSVLTLRAGQPK